MSNREQQTVRASMRQRSSSFRVASLLLALSITFVSFLVSLPSLVDTGACQKYGESDDHAAVGLMPFTYHRLSDATLFELVEEDTVYTPEHHQLASLKVKLLTAFLVRLSWLLFSGNFLIP